MKCDKCENEFEGDRLLNHNEVITRRKVEFYSSLQLDELIKIYNSINIASHLCKSCFWSDYKRASIKRLLIISVFFIIVDLFGVLLIAFGKWDSPTQRFWAGLILFSTVNGGLICIWLIYIRIFKRKNKPFEADRLAVFAPYIFDKVKAVKEELEAAEKILEIYRKHPQGFVRHVGGQPEQDLRQIGQNLYDKGDIDLMRRVHEYFRNRCDLPGAPRNLEHIWDGIGTWQG